MQENPTSGGPVSWSAGFFCDSYGDAVGPMRVSGLVRLVGLVWAVGSVTRRGRWGLVGRKGRRSEAPGVDGPEGGVRSRSGAQVSSVPYTFSTVIVISTRRSSTITRRYSSQSGCSPAAAR